MRVKICGITSLRDAEAAVESGADALGFVFFEHSPRKVGVKEAARIIRRLPPFISKVAVTVDVAAGAIRKIIETTGVDTLQFHGNETPAFCAEFRQLKVVKAFRIRPLLELKGFEQFKGATDAWLLDTYTPGQPGGTGAVFNWQIARWLRKLGHPIILAGGLTEKNVGKAIARVRPYGVDVASGVEASPGRKDLGKLRRFIEAVRNAES